MHRILTASKDTYITNKIIKSTFRATDANLGSAGTLDLFKLYNENTISGETNPIELSRILIKFPISEIAAMDSSGDIDINDSSFKCVLKLYDVYGGQTTPSNFKAILFPLAKDFDEGPGMDVVNFSDVAATNFITASVTNGSAVYWHLPGANASGSLGSSNLDVYVSGSLAGPDGTSVVSLTSIQHFETGREDLALDITTIVSGTISGQIPDKGFLIGLSGSYEKNDRSYFVKRFASRDAQVAGLRPQLAVLFNDTTTDRHSDFIFNVTSSLYLRNYQYGNLANIISGAAGTELTGADCMILKIESGSFKKTYPVSQAALGRHRQAGVYSASFAVSSFESLLYDQANLTGSITFNEVWSNSSETVTYLSSSLKIKRAERSLTNTQNQNNLLVTVLNVSDSYRVGEEVNVRVFAENRDRPIVLVRTPYEKKSQIFAEMFYRIRDDVDGKIIIDFDTSNNSTKLSTDSDGMFFTFFTDSLPPGRIYAFDFLIKRNGKDTVITDAASKFRIV